MSNGRPQETLRVPPLLDGRAGHVAQQLRQAPDALDDVSRARMERALFQAWRTRAAAHVPLPSEGRTPSRAGFWAVALAAGSLCGAVLGIYAVERADSRAISGSGTARFELRIGEAGDHTVVQRGSVSEGQVLESGKFGHIDLDFGNARVDMARGTRVRFERMSGAELRLSLEQGHVDVDFHPDDPAQQNLTIESRAARVHVVGTRFSLDVDARGNTEVQVASGSVEIVPRFGGEARRLHAGERAEVLADEGDAHERAVRSALAANLGGEEAVTEDSNQLEPIEIESVPALAQQDLGQGLRGVVQRAVLVDKPSATPPARPIIARRLEQARAQLRKGRHAAARARLQEIADRSVATPYRAEALTLIAESYAAQGQIPRAIAAYRRVVGLATGHPAAHNAQFALARLLERYTNDREVAEEAYRQYLELAPNGALASQAREALCRLGSCD